MEWLTGILNSGGLGAIVGIFGNWLAKREERKNMALQFDHTEKMAEVNAFGTSIQGQLIGTGVAWVDAIRGIMLPNHIHLFTGNQLGPCIQRKQPVDGMTSLSDVEVLDLYKQIVSQLIFLTTMVVGWWFGSRPGRAPK